MWEARGVRLLVCELPVFPIIFPSSGSASGPPPSGPSSGLLSDTKRLGIMTQYVAI
jgi:hypothetical protein